MLGAIGSTLGKLSQQLDKYMPDVYRKKLIRFLFDRYVGQYVLEDLSVDQLTLDISGGRGVLKDLVLDVHALNEVADQLNLPFIFVEGYVGEIAVAVPWRNLGEDHPFVEISGFKFTLHPKQRDGAISVVDSMMDSMSTSMQIAQECYNETAHSDCNNANHCKNDKPPVSKSSSETENINDFVSGNDVVQMVAKSIEEVLSKVRIRFIDSVIRIENFPKSSYSGIALELKIDNIDYFDEASFEKENDINADQCNEKNSIDLSSVTSKKFLIEGLSIFSDEFPIKSWQNTSEYIETQKIKTADVEKNIKTIDLETSDDEFHDTLNNSTINNLDNSNCTFNTTYESNISESSEDFPLKSSVLLAKIYNRQEIKVQLRKPDIVVGPKVKFEINCGCLVTFITPRQIHLLIELIEGIKSPEIVDHSEVISRKPRDLQKPMNQSDFKTVERDLMKRVSVPNSVLSHALNNHEGWSSPPDITWDDNLFFPFNSAQNEKEIPNPLANSTLTDISDFEASFTSTTSSNVHSNNNKKDDTLTNFKIRLNSFCIVILHDDVIIPSHDTNKIVTESSIKEMQRKVESFFSLMSFNSHSETCYEEFLELKNKVHGVCLDSHMRFIGTAVVIEGNEKVNSNKWQLNTNFTTGWFEIKECLNESDQDSKSILYSDLLVFRKTDPPPTLNQFHLPMKPKVQISINQYDTMYNSGRSHKASSPKVDVCITLDDCLTEVDISLLDRINLLLNKQNVIIRKEDYIPADKLPPSHLDNQAFFKEIMEDRSKSETKTSITVESSHITMKIFFPIPDLRPLSDMNRVPWWKKNVRKEVLWIKAEDLRLKSNICDRYPANFEILSNDIHVLFQETNDIPPVSILRASSVKDIDRGFSPVRIGIKSFPVKSVSNLDDEPMPENEDLTKSTMGFFSEMDKGAANLFNKRKVASRNQGTINELPIPADHEEINKYINEALNNVQLDIHITLTDVQLILPSKHIFEVIYNRLVSDLLLWTPSAPKCVRAMPSLSTLIDDFSIGTTLIPDSYYNNPSEFLPFTSVKNEDLQKSDYDIGYKSVYEQTCSFPKRNITKMPSGQTLLGLQVSIINAAGSIHTPYKDENSKLIPGKFGDVSFTFEKGFFFIVSGYEGDIDAVQGCAMLNTVHVYHKPHNIMSYSPIQLNSEFPLTIKKLDTILHPSDFPCRIGGGNASFHRVKDCVSICFKSHFDLLKNEKVFEVTGNLYCLTLKYYMTSTSESWVSQIQDMFNVEDYPVEGYTLPDSVTELNFHFEFCGIDYRPLYLPMKSYIAFDSLAISSNLTVKGNSSVMLFIVEDAALFLAQNLVSKKVNLKKNYVCIIDVGVFELCMKMDYSSMNMPLTELLFSNNIIHVRTCADSCKAFMELLIYFSGGGDLVQEPLTSKCGAQTGKVVIEPSFTEEIAPSQYNQNTLVNQRDLIASRMKEAMMDLDSSDASHDASTRNERNINVDEFFFPGENLTEIENDDLCTKNSLQLDVETAINEALKEDFSNTVHNDGSLKGSDEEFCVLDDIPGTGIKSPTGRPKAKHIRHEHVSIKDGYFDPSANEYESRFITPKHFPRPYCKYNLQEMSIVWHMYGGEDFVVDDNCNSDKNGNKFRNARVISQSPLSSPEISNRANKGLSVSFAKGDANVTAERNSPLSLHGSPTTLLKPNANVKWFSTGGPNRNHDILMEVHLSKIRFKYEMYSEECPLVSRHVFIINDIEIKDRLMSSKINKFLYQFSCEAFPKQASSNMIQVKAISRRCDPVCMYETNLNISCRPIRLNIDQDALLFMCKFIGHLMNIDRESEYGEEEKPYNLQHTPVMSLKCNNESNSASQVIYFNNSTIIEHQDKTSNSAPIYFRNVVFSPDVPIRIDYHGKHIDINSQYGPIAGLIIGLGQLNNSEVTLKRIEFKSGVLGVNKLITSLVNEWMLDIKQNQLPSILGGVGPMHSFVMLFGGIKDLFWLPIEQYNKDGRVFRGIQRGTSAFTSSSAYAVLDLTARFIGTIQSTAETMYDMVSSGPSVKNKAYKTRKGQPKDIREGVTTAYGLVRNGLGDTASALIKVATEEHSHKGVSGAVGGLLRQIPPSVVQPIIIASEATCTVIGGMTNQLVPDAGREAADKWKS